MAEPQIRGGRTEDKGGVVLGIMPAIVLCPKRRRRRNCYEQSLQRKEKERRNEIKADDWSDQEEVKIQALVEDNIESFKSIIAREGETI